MEKIYSPKSLIKYLIFLFPFFLISGPFLPDLLISVFALLVLFYLTKKKILLRSNIFYFFLIFYIYININSFFYSDTKLVSLKSTLPYIRFILFSLFLGVALSRIKDLKKIIFYSFLLSYLVLLIDSCFQLISGYNFLGYPLTQRVSSLFGDELIMGSFVVRTLPLVLAISYANKSNSNFFLQLLILMVAGILVYFSSERTSVAFYFFILFAYLIFNFKNIKFFFIIIIFFFLLFSLLFFIKKDSSERLVVHTINQFNNDGINQHKNKIFFSYRHTLHYSTALDMFKDSKLFGHGVKSFRYLCSKDKYSQFNKIKEDNMIYAPIDGFFFYSKNF
jgi:O-antigen ligase